MDVQAGDVIGFEELYRKYSQAVFCFALRLCGDRSRAEDVTSETFLRVWTASDRLRIATVKAYLFAIARNLYLQELRDCREEPLETAAEPETRAIDWETRDRAERVMRALQQLPEVDRTALLLRADGELSYDEIAQVLEISSATARVKVHRARMRLAEICRIEEVRK